MTAILYSTGCSRCKVIEKKLQDKNIPYTICDDENEIIKKGFAIVPWLVIDNNPPMDFIEANKWINEQEG